MTFCDTCGDRIAPDETIERDGWTLTRREAKHNGERQKKLRPQHACFLWVLARNAGRILSAESLGLRIALNPEDLEAPRTLATVTAHRIRKLVANAPIETVHGQGYRWAA